MAFNIRNKHHYTVDCKVKLILEMLFCKYTAFTLFNTSEYMLNRKMIPYNT